MEVIVSTVGTSLITNCVNGDSTYFTSAESQLLRKHTNAMTSTTELDTLLTRVNSYLSTHLDAFVNTAEMIAIRKYVQRTTGKLGIKLPNTDYIWLSSHTVLGQFCASKLAEYVRTRTDMIDVTSYPMNISQLQVHAADELDSGWRNLRDSLDDIHRTYRSDVVYNVTGGYKLLSGLVQSYAANRSARVIYTFEGDSPLVIVDVNATGIHPEITFYQHL